MSENTTVALDAIAASLSSMGDILILLVLAMIPLVLTAVMFTTKNAMLGFPSALMWAVLGGFAYTLSSTAWGDWQYYLAFASLLGMTTFCALGAYGLREKLDSLGDVAMERGDTEFTEKGDIQELKKDEDEFDVASRPSRSKGVRRI